MKTPLLLPLFLMLALGLQAQPELLTSPKKGLSMSNFKLKNANNNINGTDMPVGFADFKNAKGFVVLFSCQDCPQAENAEAMMESIHRRFAPLGYPVVVINTQPDGSKVGSTYEAMRSKAKSQDYPYAYLLDDYGNVADIFGASYAPQLFVIKERVGEYNVLYKGSVKADANSTADLIDAVLQGQKSGEDKAGSEVCRF